MLALPELAHKVQAAQDRERAWLHDEFGDELREAADQLDKDHRQQDKPAFVPPSTSRDREFAPEQPPAVFDAPPMPLQPQETTSEPRDTNRGMGINNHVYDVLTDSMLKDIDNLNDNDLTLHENISKNLSRNSVYMHQHLPPDNISDGNTLLNIMRRANLIGPPHVTESYSSPKYISLARRIRLRPGSALVLTTADDDDGTPWDFNNS